MVFGKGAPWSATLGAQEMDGASLPSPRVGAWPCTSLKPVTGSGRPKSSG